MTQVLFHKVADQASENEQALVTRVVGSVVLNSLLKRPVSSFDSTYNASGGHVPETHQVLSELQAAWDSLDLSEVRRLFSSVNLKNLTTEERSLIERTIGTAFWRSLEGGAPVNPTAIYRSLGGSRSKTIKLFEAASAHFSRIDFNLAA